MSLTTDPNDPRLKAGQKIQGQNDVYLVLSEEERAKGFVRPYRDSYLHVGKNPVMKGVVLITAGEGGCGARTIMGRALSETYARDPKFYGATFCVGCNKHLPISEFLWDGTNEVVGS
jgi:hypothetical protein